MKTREMLEKVDPPAVFYKIHGFVEYLERPKGGWRLYDDCFIGIGDHGNESGDYKEDWQPTKADTGDVYDFAASIIIEEAKKKKDL